MKRDKPPASVSLNVGARRVIRAFHIRIKKSRAHQNMQIIATMISRWKVEGIGLLPPEAESKIRASFECVGSIATSDVISLYAAIGGMDEMDKEDWRLWSLGEIMSQNEEPSPYGVLFADFLVECWHYRLRPNDNDTSAVFIDFGTEKPPIQIASSVDEFFRTYADDPFHLLYGPAKASAVEQ